MAFEAGINLAWILILSLAVLIVMIGFYLFFRVGVQGGWLSGIASALKWLVNPPV